MMMRRCWIFGKEDEQLVTWLVLVGFFFADYCTFRAHLGVQMKTRYQ